MNIAENSLGLLFTEKRLPDWIEYFAILFLIVIVFAIKFLISNFKDYNGAKRIVFVLFIASFIYLCVNSILLLYPLNQYNNDFKVELNYKSNKQQVILSSDKHNLKYTDKILNFKAFYSEFERSTLKSTNNNVMGKYHLYLLRKDGLLVSLNTYEISDWNVHVIPLLQKTTLPIITDTSILDIKTHSDSCSVQLNYDVTQLVKNLKFGTITQNKNEITYEVGLHGNKILNSIIIPLFLLFWTGAILSSINSYESKGNRLFKYTFLVLFSASWSFYYVSNFGKHHIVFSDSGYQTFTTNKLIKKINENKGNWKDAKKSIAYIANSNTMGITLYETNVSTNVTDILSAVTSGKVKSIRLDGVEWYDQIMLSDFVLSKKNINIK